MAVIAVQELSRSIKQRVQERYMAEADSASSENTSMQIES